MLCLDIKAGIDKFKQAFSPEIFRRTINYLYSKETRSSYEIEKEKPSPQRMERFISLLMLAGKESSEEVLMEGLKKMPGRTQTTPAMVRSALVAFGFVFIHPFEDGNGRLHRFLIHDMLVRDGLVTDGLIIPVSAHMLNHIKEYDQALENFSKPLMCMIKYSKNDKGEITVDNSEEIEGYFRFPDLTVQSTFLARTNYRSDLNRRYA